MKSDFIIKLKHGGFIKKIQPHYIVVCDDVNDAQHFTMSQIKHIPFIRKCLKRDKINIYGRKADAV